MGGYLSTFGPNIPTNLYGLLLAGVYTTPAIYCEVKGVFTNTVPVDAYRGAGRPEATFVLERLVDVAASEMGIDQAEIRRRNMIDASQYPYQTPVMVKYDSGDPKACLAKALEVADWAGFAARKAESAARGKLRGIGLCTYVEACGLAPSRIVQSLGARGGIFESATVRVHPTGDVTVLIGTHSHGQGHETTFAQIVSEQLGHPDRQDRDRLRRYRQGPVRPRHLRLALAGGRRLRAGQGDRQGDRSRARRSPPTCSRRAMATSSSRTGCSRSPAPTGRKTFGDVVGAAYGLVNFPLEILEPGLEEQAFYDPVNFTFPGGAHIAEVEIDPDTGVVELLSYTAVDDIGTVINPMIVEGQLHGGIVQGVGQALFENCVYDDESRPDAVGLVHGLLPCRAPTTCPT